MFILGKTRIIKDTGSEIVVARVTDVISLLFTVLGIGAAVGSFFILATSFVSDYQPEAVCFTIPFFLPLGILALWMGQAPWITNEIKFNQPPGYVTVIEPPAWAGFIPGGFFFLSKSRQISLYDKGFYVETDNYTTTIYQRGVWLGDFSNTRYMINTEDENGNVYRLWYSTDSWVGDRIIERVNQAKQVFEQSIAVGTRK